MTTSTNQDEEKAALAPFMMAILDSGFIDNVADCLDPEDKCRFSMCNKRLYDSDFHRQDETISFLRRFSFSKSWRSSLFFGKGLFADDLPFETSKVGLEVGFSMFAKTEHHLLQKLLGVADGRHLYKLASMERQAIESHPW